MKGVKGCEFYSTFSNATKKHGKDALLDMFVNLHIWGTPKQCYEKIAGIRQQIGADNFIGVFSYAHMSWGEVNRNFELFTQEVKPALQQLPSLETWAKHAA